MTQNEQFVRLENKGQTLAGGKLKVVIVGATGMVGQQLVRLLNDHPWFEVVAVAASTDSEGKTYRDAVSGRWTIETAIPKRIGAMKLINVQRVEEIASLADLVFCAVNLDKEGVLKLEHAYAAQGLWVTSNNSANRADPFVPMVIPAVNADHLTVIPLQRKARGYSTGAIMVKSNCSIQSYVIALDPLREFGIKWIRVHSEQAISGAGKTFNTWPEMEKNLIPFISGEERKCEVEPLKIWGQVGPHGIVAAAAPNIKAKCVRVSTLHGHTAYVRVKFESAPTASQIMERWEQYQPSDGLPSAPRKLIHYLHEPDRPQPRLDAMAENGMAVSIGQLKVEKDEEEVSFTALSHNLILGAAGGAVLATEAAVERELIYRRL